MKCQLYRMLDNVQVESLSASRQSVSANEPLDSIRVVNALLTQLDAIKRSVCDRLSAASLIIVLRVSRGPSCPEIPEISKVS